MGKPNLMNIKQEIDDEEPARSYQPSYSKNINSKWESKEVNSKSIQQQRKDYWNTETTNQRDLNKLCDKIKSNKNKSKESLNHRGNQLPNSKSQMHHKGWTKEKPI